MFNKKGTLILKRSFDIIVAFLGLFIFSGLWAVIMLSIYLADGCPVYFYDIRVGRDKRTYRHLKFRTMIKEAEGSSGPVWSIEEDNRVTKIGRILRATAMDELPQLINILKGDMSFVGPRPERPYFVEKFSREILGYARRFSVRPGLTGLAQVYARHDTLPQEKLRFDLAYIQRSNPLLDLKLIFLSFLITFKAGWERFEREKVS